jgi:acyl-CoA dehydrogenase
MAVGIARAAYEYGLKHEQFGKKSGDFQAVAVKLADMKTQIDASRLLVWRATARNSPAPTARWQAARR